MEIDYFKLICKAFEKEMKKLSYVFDSTKKVYYLQINDSEFPMGESDFFELFWRLFLYTDKGSNSANKEWVINAIDNRITKIAEDIETIETSDFSINNSVENITDETSQKKYRIEYNGNTEYLSYEEAVYLLEILGRIAGFHEKNGEDYTRYFSVVFFIVMLKVVVKEENLNVEEYLNTKV